MSEDLKQLSLRIERIEKAIEGISKERVSAESKFSDEELAAYRKVRDVIAEDYGKFCGINDCFRCVVSCITQCINVCEVICNPCDFECACGPCNPGGLRGRVGRFGRMG